MVYKKVYLCQNILFINYYFSKMKQFSLVFMTMLLITFHAFSQSFSSAAEYNNFIVAEQTKIAKKNINYVIKSVHSKSARKIESKRTAVIKQIDKSLKKVKKMKGFDNKTKLKSEAIEMLEEYKDVYLISYKEINALAETQQESFKNLEKYFKAQDKAEERLNKAAQKFSKAQKQFAKDHNMKLEDSHGKLEEKMQQISEVNEYSRKIFLIYFKVSKANGIVLDAMNAKKANVVESKSKELVSLANEALTALEGVPVFKGNSGYRAATKNLVSFYLTMGSQKYSQLPNLMKKEKQNKLTQKEADKYNKIIQDYNVKATDLINKFNIENQKLLQSNVPEQEVSE